MCLERIQLDAFKRKTQLLKTDGTVFTEEVTASRISLHHIFPSLNRVDRSKPTSEKNKRTSEANVDDPITGDSMKKLKGEEDTNPHTQPNTNQTKPRTTKRCAMKERKAPNLLAKRKPKRNAR